MKLATPRATTNVYNYKFFNLQRQRNGATTKWILLAIRLVAGNANPQA